MTIAFVHYHHHLNRRGAETYVKELSKRLANNHQVYLLAPTNARFISRSRLDLWQRLFLDPVSLATAAWTLRQLPRLSRLNPQVVIALNGGWQTLILRLWTKATGAKLVISGQSGPGWDDRWNLYCHPDLFICLTRRQLHWGRLIFHWPKQKFALIPNGVDLKQFTPRGAKATVDLTRPVVLCVAASETSKRIDLTIRAVAKLKHASLLLIGRGPLDSGLDALGQSLLGSRRFLHLQIPHDQMPAYYRATDLFTLCSRSSEAFGIVYAEALASNLPVVATKDASRREIIGNAGIYVSRPDNPTRYARKLEAALSRRWGNRPRRQAQRFSWEVIASLYDQTLTRL